LESPIPETELLDRLIEAYQCCSDCGDKYGTYRAGASSHWPDTCDVCGAETVVTEARDYGYLYKGIRLLKNF
jgi:hypothetical protein